MVNNEADRRPGYRWVGTVGCEGGPLLVCEVDAFAAWGGAVLGPDDELDRACDLNRADAVLALHALPEQDPPVNLDLDDIAGVGTLLRVRPGRYQVSCGSHQGTRGQYQPFEEQYGPAIRGTDDDWSCRWLRFARSDG